MRSRRLISCLAAPVLLFVSGCGYVHVGRVPAPVTNIVGDEKLLRENADLRLEKKILQQELALTRAQGDALRIALENRTADGDTTKRLVEQLNTTTRQLNELRASYAKIQGDLQQGGLEGDAALLRARLGATEEKLAASLRSYTELQEEVGRLRTEVTKMRGENRTLTLRLRTVTAQNEQAQAALAQLNTDLLAEKDARVRAEQDALTLRTELRAVAPDSSVLAQQRTGAAAQASSLVPEASAEPKPAVMLKPIPAAAAKVRMGGADATFVARMASGSRESAPRSDGRSALRLHVVTGGDTLAKISARYYGTPGRWSDILAANRDVLGDDNDLIVGRTLRIP